MGTLSRMKNQASRFVNGRFSDLSAPFTIESFVSTPDAQGGLTVAWSTFATVTGFVNTSRADEIILDDHQKALNIKEFSFEHVDGLNASMRIVYGGVNYNILSIKSVEDSTVWDIVTASEDVAT
jgi:hypothetical protein